MRGKSSSIISGKGKASKISFVEFVGFVKFVVLLFVTTGILTHVFSDKSPRSRDSLVPEAVKTELVDIATA